MRLRTAQRSVVEIRLLGPDREAAKKSLMNFSNMGFVQLRRREPVSVAQATDTGRRIT
jgi:hypothetical protein